MPSTFAKLILALAAAAILAGCQTIEQKRKIDYRNTRTLPPLEVPPDLTRLPDREHPGQGSGTTGSATYSGLTQDQKNMPAPGAGTQVLPQYPGVRLARDGQSRWLVVQSEPQALWDSVREFVLANGLVIAEENPTTGVIETDWAENRAKIGTGSQRLLTKWLGALYSTGTRDRYRVRLERGIEPGTTEIYLSHQGMEEEVPAELSSSSGGSIWKPRPTDPELETEMLQRLVAHLGGERAIAQAKAASASASGASSAAVVNARLRRDGNGGTLLSLQDSLDRAWRRVGLSLDRIGFTVEDRDRSKGIYYVRYIDPDKQGKARGMISRWFGGEEKTPPNQYQVHVKPAETGTEVEVLDQNGAPDTSKTGDRILGLLYEQLK